MSDRSKWPPVAGEQFTQAWINLKELPGGMMQSYSTERGHFRYGPIPATTSCGITTNPDDAQRWREQGQPVIEVYAAAGVHGCSHCYDGGCGDPLGCGETDRRKAGEPVFDPALLAKAVMTPEQEASARRGWCMKCEQPTRPSLIEKHREGGMRWLQCSRCQTVYALGVSTVDSKVLPPSDADAGGER